MIGDELVDHGYIKSLARHSKVSVALAYNSMWKPQPVGITCAVRLIIKHILNTVIFVWVFNENFFKIQL